MTFCWNQSHYINAWSRPMGQLFTHFYNTDDDKMSDNATGELRKM